MVGTFSLPLSLLLFLPLKLSSMESILSLISKKRKTLKIFTKMPFPLVMVRLSFLSLSLPLPFPSIPISFSSLPPPPPSPSSPSPFPSFPTPSPSLPSFPLFTLAPLSLCTFIFPPFFFVSVRSLLFLPLPSFSFPCYWVIYQSYLLSFLLPLPTSNYYFFRCYTLHFSVPPLFSPLPLSAFSPLSALFPSSSFPSPTSIPFLLPSPSFPPLCLSLPPPSLLSIHPF